MSAIADRFRIIAAKCGGIDPLSVSVGKSRTWLGNTIRRLGRDPLAIELRNVVLFAEKAGVHPAWLAFGLDVGEPTDEREKAARAAKLLGFGDAVVNAVLAGGRDRTAREYLRRIELEEEQRLDGVKDLPPDTPRVHARTPTGEIDVTSIRGTKTAERRR